MSEKRGGGRLLGLDIGSRRIGVAVSDEYGTIASPVEVVLRQDQSVDRFRELVMRYDAIGLVAGLPKGMSGREGPQADDARAYAGFLAQSLQLPLSFWDERLTTVSAERSLIESGLSRDKRRDSVDAVAAALMLQNFLDAASSRRTRAADRGR